MKNDELIKYLVDRFLCWKLPKDFNPDCGISFDGRKDDEWNINKQWPVGTNLFTASQAKSMFEHLLSQDIESEESAYSNENDNWINYCEPVAYRQTIHGEHKGKVNIQYGYSEIQIMVSDTPLYAKPQAIDAAMIGKK